MSGLKPITVNTAPEADPHIYAEDDAAIYQSIFGSDGVMTIGQQCTSQVISNNKVRVKDGVIVVGGHVARIPYGEYIDCEIANGQSGKNRNDIIIAKFVTTGSGGIDTYTCEVKQGVAGSSASDPALTQNDLYAGGKIREMPLYRVKIEGLSIVAVEQLFKLVPTIPELEEQLAELNSNLKRITYSFASISWTNPVYSIQKIAGVVYFDYYCQVTEGIGVTSYGIAKLPQNITPVDHAIKLAAWTADGNGKRNPASVEIKTDGMVDLVSGGDFVEAGFSVSYPI